MKLKWFWFCLVLCFQLCGNAQLVLKSDISADDLVNKYFLGEHSGLKIYRAQLVGSPQAAGIMIHDSPYAIFEKAIVLSTGYIHYVAGPNNQTNGGGPIFMRGDLQISRIINAPTFDATALIIDFEAETDSVSFSFFFASEEYPEYVNRNVNDFFGFYLFDSEESNPISLAQLPNGKGNIEVDNVNHLRNSEYYLENGIWDESNILQWENNRALGELTYSYQFDGFTVPINVGARLIPGARYRLKIVIADVGDAAYDSAVFLKANSLNSKPSKQTQKQRADQLTKALKEKFTSTNYRKISDSLFLVIGQVEFDFDKSTIRDVEQPVLERVNSLLTEFNFLTAEIQGHTDSRGDDEYNLSLSENRAQSVLNWLVANGVNKERLNAVGYGEQRLIAVEKTEQDYQRNRRVEFYLKLPQ